MHYGTKPGHFETSIIHFPTSEGVSEVSGASKRTSEWPSTYISLLVCFRPQWDYPEEVFLPGMNLVSECSTMIRDVNIGPLARQFARTAQSFACFALLASVKRSASLIRSLVRSLSPKLVRTSGLCSSNHPLPLFSLSLS